MANTIPSFAHAQTASRKKTDDASKHQFHKRTHANPGKNYNRSACHEIKFAESRCIIKTPNVNRIDKHQKKTGKNDMGLNKRRHTGDDDDSHVCKSQDNCKSPNASAPRTAKIPRFATVRSLKRFSPVSV